MTRQKKKTQPPAAERNTAVAVPRTFLARYGALVAATTVFLILITAILVGGMYYGERVNRHRFMSITINHVAGDLNNTLRTLLDIRVMRDQNRPAELQRLHDALQSTLQGVDQGLNALQHGGPAAGAAPGSTITVPAATDSVQRSHQESLLQLWQPLKTAAAAYLASVNQGNNSEATLNEAISIVQTHANDMLQVAGRIDGRIRATSRENSDRGTQIETFGISLAIAYFVLFMLYFMRTLWQTDRKVQVAQRETLSILDTVQEGLFLLDRNLNIGTQFSKSLETVLDRAISPGDSLKDYLRQKLSRRDYEASVDYIELLFDEHVIEELIGDINPLDQLEILDQHEKRYLSFNFNRVRGEQERTRHLLVTVQDVTRQVRLEQDLEAARRTRSSEMNVLFEMLEADPALLRGFIDNARQKLNSINQKLETVGRDEQHALIDPLFRSMHTLKGEAATLKLSLFEQTFQAFENTLRGLRDNPDMEGSDLLSLIPHFETSFARLDQAEQLIERITPSSAATAADTGMSAAAHETAAYTAQIAQLAERIAGDQRKEVVVHTDLTPLSLLDVEQRQKVRDIITQCVRNAIAHGIEEPDVRLAAGKHAQGTLQISLNFVGRNRLLLECSDDGSGIDVQAIRARLQSSPNFEAGQVAAMSDEDVARQIFGAGFSTATPGGRDAGQGVGLPVVRERAEELHGHVHIHSTPGKGTTFEVQFPARIIQP